MLHLVKSVIQNKKTLINKSYKLLMKEKGKSVLFSLLIKLMKEEIKGLQSDKNQESRCDG